MQGPFLSYTHINETLIPSFNDLTDTQGEGNGLASRVGAIELGTIFQGPSVVHANIVAGFSLTGALDIRNGVCDI